MFAVNVNGATLIVTTGGVSYYRVPSTGLSSANIVTTCAARGMKALCSGPAGCNRNSGDCKVTSLSTICHYPMRPISRLVCGGSTAPNRCQKTQNLYTYQYNYWGGDSFGATTTTYANGKENQSGEVLCVT